MKPVMPKRFFATLITTLFLFSLNVMPANAVTETVSCGGGGTFTIVDNVVTESSYESTDESTVACAGAVNIPSGVVKIEDAAFLDRPITSVNIPNTVTEIGSDAFSYTELVSVTIPDSVTNLGGYVFLYTTTLTSVTIGNRVTSIGDDAFGNTALTSINIPNSVTTIGNRAFQGVSTLTSVTIGNRVTSIGPLAFDGNTALTSITIPSSVTSIESGAFSGSTVNSFTFSGNAPASVADDAFPVTSPPATANVAYNATGFPANGSIWKRLSVVYGNAPSNDSGSTTASVTAPTIVKTADVVFNLKNKKYLSKNAMKTKLSKNKSFKRNPKDLYKYSIFKASKKNCVMSGNYVMALKKTGSCDLYATRTTPKGAKYKYWVKINYVK